MIHSLGMRVFLSLREILILIKKKIVRSVTQTSKYETINLWESIHDILVEWIDTVILEGWSLYRGREKLVSISQDLTNRIALVFHEDFEIEEEIIQRLIERFQPTIFYWIDNILLISWGFYQDPQKYRDFSNNFSRDLVELYLDEEKKVNWKGR